MDTSSILEQLVSLNADRAANEPAAREKMLIAAQALVTSLQTPSEFISCVGWAEPARFACLRTALDLQIFETLSQEGLNNGANATELARVTGAEEGLVYLVKHNEHLEDECMLTAHCERQARILRHLVAMNILVELTPGRFVNTKLSTQFVEPRYRDGILYCYDVAGPSFRQMPAYLEKHQFKQPLNPIDGPFQFAHDTRGHFFTWLTENPTYLGAFASYMAGYRDGKQPWFAPSFYPVQAKLIEGFRSTTTSTSTNPVKDVFLVDVGGGKGHDLLGLRTAFPSSLPGPLVLQDKPEVITSISPPLPSDIRTMSHDFFTPQPIKGARAYFLHSVLHDWDDQQCIEILEALRPALTPGYSKILVHDLIVPDLGATWGVTSMDMLMMALGSVRERTEADFRRLFDAAGFQVDGIWVYEQGTEGVIEASIPVGGM